MAIKVIIMDVDGTLTNNDKVMTAKTKAALLKAQDNGATLILASGRPTSGLIGLGKELGMDKHHGLFVSYNGSKVVDCETGEEYFNQAMTVEEGKAVLEHMKKFDRVRPMIDKDEYMYVNDVYDCMIDWNGGFNVLQYEARGGNYLLCEKQDLAAFADFEINKILTTSDPQYLQDNYEAMMAPFKDSLNCVFTAPFYFEFTALGIDKAKALDTVLIPRGFKREEMIGFGDGHNDKTMLEYCGTAVAMGNAVDDVKAIADYITADNNNDGIAEALYKFMPEVFSE